MAKAIEDIAGLKVGHFGLGTHGAGIGSVKQQVHDGDTIIVRTLGNLSIRFLGVDTPEVSITLPPGGRFESIGGASWAAFLDDPFSDRFGAIALAPALQRHLAARVGSGCAANHFKHAQAAQRALEAEVQADLDAAAVERSEFRFFLAFASEVMDGYGRLLGYVNKEQRSKPRPPDYNGRLLAAGFALPYFIWPNINPFRKQTSMVDAVPPPGGAAALANRESSLRAARMAVRAARDEQRGVFEAADPLRLEPFELRYLAGRRPPSRWVLDLTSDGDMLLPPQRYFEIPNPEDRLFVPEQYVALFVEKGWRRGAAEGLSR